MASCDKLCDPKTGKCYTLADIHNLSDDQLFNIIFYVVFGLVAFVVLVFGCSKVCECLYSFCFSDSEQPEGIPLLSGRAAAHDQVPPARSESPVSDVDNTHALHHPPPFASHTVQLSEIHTVQMSTIYHPLSASHTVQ